MQMTTAHPTTNQARATLSLLTVSAIAAMLLARHADITTGSVPADQAVLVLRCAVFALAGWLIVAVGAGVIAARVAVASPGAPAPTPITRVAERVTPRRIRFLAERALGAAVILAVVSTAVPGTSSASARSSTTAAAHPARPYVVDAASGQQWPVVDAQAESTTQGTPRTPMPPVAAVDRSSTTSTAVPTTATTTTTSTTTTSTTTTSTTTTSTTTTSATTARPVRPGPVGPALPTPLTDGPDRSGRHVVVAGESFWSIAEATLALTGHPVTDAQLVRYWRAMIEVNTEALPVPGNPDLLYPGTILTLPASDTA